MSDVNVYGCGPFACSVCVPKGMPRETVEDEVNVINPTGISSPWTVSSSERFHTGEEHPKVCEHDPTRLHWLLEC